MGLKTITIFKKNISSNSDIRFDCKYFIVNDFFNSLEKESSCSVIPLSNLDAEISSGSYVDNYVKKETGTPYIRVGNIKPLSIDEQEKSLVYVSKDLPDKIKVKEFDVIMGRTQATADKLGVASIVDKSISNSVLSQHVTKVRLNNYELITPEYLAAYFNSNFYKAQTSLSSHGDTRVEMTHSQMKQIKVFIPEKNIVEDITKKVKKISLNNRASVKLIKKSSEIIKRNLKLNSNNKKNYFNINMSEIKNFGIWNAISHLPSNREIENQINSKFKTIPLGDICEIKKGIEVGSANYATDLQKENGYYAFIRTSDIINNEVDLFPDYFVSSTHPDVESNSLKGNEILFSKDGIIGETAIVSKYDRIVCASGFAIITPNNIAKKLGLSKEYIFAILSLDETGYIPARRRTVIASTIPHLRIDRLKEIKIPIFRDNINYEIESLVKEAFILKDERKRLIKDVRNQIDILY